MSLSKIFKDTTVTVFNKPDGTLKLITTTSSKFGKDWQRGYYAGRKNREKAE